MLSTLIALAGIQSSWPKGDEMERALLATLDKHFYNAETKTWREMDGKQDHVFLWGYTVLMSTFAIGARVDPATYKPRMEAAFEGLEKYWTTKAPGGYAVLPGQGRNPDRYYDDNAWVGLAAMEAYDALTDKKHIEVAPRAFTFVVSGEDDKLGGGIYWHENDKKSKNACVSGPGACLAFQLYSVTKDQIYRDSATRWMKWTEKLIDPEDSLVSDNIKLDGTIDRTKWSYNTAMLMEAKCSDLEAASDSKLRSLFALSQSAAKKWIVPSTHLVSNPGMFAMHLIEAEYRTTDEISRLELVAANQNSASKDWIEPICEAVYAKSRNSDGLLGEWWNRPPKKNEQLKLMYTASLLRTVLLAKSHS